MSGTAPVLVLDSIGKSYGHRAVLRSAYFQAVPGQLHGLLGRNGSGKTTLLHLAAGLSTPDHGLIRFGGEVVESGGLAGRAARGMFFWPVARPLFSAAMRVDDVFRGARERWPAEAWQPIVQRLHLRELLPKRGAALSGGEAQRCHLALAMLRRPTCLLADEPFRGVAPTDADLMTACLRELARDGAAIVLTGHELGTMLETVEDITWVTGGTTRYLGPTREACTDEAFRREYLGPGAPPPPTPGLPP
ncbi:MAG TPA: ATP-binding cassette domain-containing protein [Gemmatimonadales bacterium]|nr:ATP-binding cassette domain-containing protein [Gemmatimonadales bacterium]